MARRKPVDEHLNHEAWAIPYGDLITLLLAFFVVMYAISTVNESKYRVLSDALSDAFSGPPRSVKPVQVGPAVRTSSSAGLKIDIRPQLALRQRAITALAQDAEAQKRAEQQALNRALAEHLRAELPMLLENGQISVRAHDDGVDIEVGSDFLFASGSARGQARADELLRSIGAVLADLSFNIRVEGHTDNVRINTLQFPSNWELSAARAAWVVRQLAENGVPPQRLSMQGFAEHRGIASNDSEAGRRANRRVSIVLDTTDTARMMAPVSDTDERVSASPDGNVVLAVRGPKPAQPSP